MYKYSFIILILHTQAKYRPLVLWWHKWLLTQRQNQWLSVANGLKEVVLIKNNEPVI